MIKAIPYLGTNGYDNYAVWRAGNETTNWWWDYKVNDDVGDWHHFAIVYDETIGTSKLYFDGEVKNTSAINAGDSMANINAFKLFSRTQNTPAAWDSFKGKMDDVQIYDNALTEAEVNALIPEPATIALLGLGGLALIRRKK